MTTADFFFDSYALIEIIKGNERYARYMRSGMIFTKLNLFETYYAFLRENLPTVAENVLIKYYPFNVDFEQSDIQAAAQLKLLYRKRKLSMADCIGYVLAQRAGMKFLTGDRDFADLPGVEFVKAGA